MRTLSCFILVILATTSARAAQTNSSAALVDYELRVADKPIIQRGFLPESSPRSIAVGLPGGLSYCFDAEFCLLRYAWSGGFLDMKPTWRERGASPPKLRGAKFFVAPATISFRVGDLNAAPKTKFLGYEIVEKRPVFRFSVNGVVVKERIEAAPGGGLRCEFELDEAKDEILFHSPKGVSVSAAGRELAGNDAGWVKIPRGSPTRFQVSIPGPDKAAANTTKETTKEK